MRQATDPTATAPEQFGPYEIHERLGMGGMASVYRAKKRGPAGFERTVALKRMLSHLAEDKSFVESFVREAKVASMLVHANIAQVYDFGRINGVYYIAMELVAGFDVRKLLRYANRSNEAIPLPVVLSILGEMCDALEYAHSFADEQGTPLNIVHRDISPSNLIIAHTGHVKVIDFGIAKASSRQLHTESGSVKGKLGYMSPEVALGMHVGPVSDIFSAGVVAWELVTASPLFSARTDFETMWKIREGEIRPPSEHNPSCPPELDRVILSALARDAENRLVSAREFRIALDEIAKTNGIQITARPVAEWIRKFAQPEDTWARPPEGTRNRTPSGRQLPLPAPEQITTVSRPRVAQIPLRRSEGDIQLATEIWGEDGDTQQQQPEDQPDYSAEASGDISMSMPTYVPPTQPLVSLETPVVPQRSKRPVMLLGVLAMIAGVLAGVLIWKQMSASEGPVEAPAPGVSPSSVRFVIEPAGAVIEIGGKEVGRTSPFETELAAGVYSITVRQDGYRSWTSSLTLREGERQTVNVALEPEQVAVAVVTEPAVVVIDPPKPDPGPDTATQRPKQRDPKRPRGAAHKVAAPDPVKVDPPKVDPPKADPPKIIPPKVDPPKVDPPPPDKPARTPVVAQTAVTKLSGEIPTLRSTSGDSTGDVLVKMCIDEQGKVSSVKIVKSTADIAAELQRALQAWRYKPYLNRDNKPSPVCFPLSLRLVIKRG